MRRLLIIFAVLTAVWVAQTQGVALGQETATPTPTITETPTITPTPTNTPTPTPDLFAYVTLPPPDATQEGTPGIPSPGQAAAVVYTISVGEATIAVMVLAVLVSLWCMALIWLWRSK